MNKNNLNRGFHLTYEERIFIERALDEKRSFKEIAATIGKHPTTISKEVRRHRISVAPRVFNNEYAINKCVLRFTCSFTNVCFPYKCGLKKCRTCGKCNVECKFFELDECKKPFKPPYVCNACPKRSRHCVFGQYIYKANVAHREYVETLHESRAGINLTKEQLACLDDLVSPLILKGQPLAHVYAAHSSEIPVSIRTLYNYVEKQYLTVRNIDLRRKVRYKVRNQRRPSKATLLAIKLERRYRDFIRYVEEYDPEVVEMDTVMGSKSSKVCLLTILFRKSRLMWAFRLDENTQAAVIEKFDYIEKIIGSSTFKKLFPVVLADNGSEFLRPQALERSIDGSRRTLIFYCDPNSAFQKGAIEKNHEYIRYVVPKGFGFDSCSQDDINLLMSHINSVKRKQLAGLSPFEAAPNILKNASKKLGIDFISPDEINLTASLLLK